MSNTLLNCAIIEHLSKFARYSINMLRVDISYYHYKEVIISPIHAKQNRQESKSTGKKKRMAIS